MPDAHQLALMFSAAFIAALLPGPGLLYTLARTLRGGRREGLRSAAGLFLGGQAHTLAAAFGLSALLASSAAAYGVLKLCGAAYLIYLGVKTLLSKEPLLGEIRAPEARAVFWQGVWTEVLNPKTALFFLTFIPQFVQPERGAPLLQFLLLGFLANVVFTCVEVLLVVLASPLAEKLRSSLRFRRALKLGSGSALVGLGTYAALER